MIGQHFDTLWLYAQSITDKYDADNRLDFGISKDLVEEFINFEKVIILDPDSPNHFTEEIKKISNNVLLVIGPEGGIDESEMLLFKNAKADFASLGKSILRTSSAGAVSAAILLAQTKWIK